MKKTKQFLRPLLMAIVMLAMSPASLWAAQVDGMDIPEDPLCFEAKEDGATIIIGQIVSDYVLYYSLDNKNTWKRYNRDEVPSIAYLEHAGDKVYLFGNITSKEVGVDFTMIQCFGAKVAASGKLSSILGGATSIPDCGCSVMFAGCDQLISAPDMSDITEIGKSGCEAMYQNCPVLTSVPAMNSLTTIKDQGCSQMFADCTSLTTAPEMNSLTTIGQFGCNEMFSRCTKLTTAPAMGSLTTIEFCGCVSMFDECPLIAFELNTVPSVEEFGLYVDKDIALTLTDDSYVFTGENPGFPELTSATYTRTGIKNQWGTIVVPFNVNGSGADYDLYTLLYEDEYNLTLSKYNGTLPAGTPVIFRLHDDLAGNYNLTLTASNTTVSGQLNDGSEANGLQLVGTYETTELDINDYFISNNQFWRVYDAWATAWGVKVAPFRAYLKSKWAGAKASSLNIRIADEDDDVTAVETLNAITDGTAEYYDMNGRRINSLQKGVNIVKMSNGKTKKVNIK